MNNPTVIGVIMDPIEKINITKDSTWAMILAAQKRGWEVRYMQQADLFTSNGRVYAESRVVKLFLERTAGSSFRLHARMNCLNVMLY